jgi:DNA-binding transcriptional regulator YiaG
MEMKPYRYAECGLDYIWLANGFAVHKTADGEDVIVIDDVAGLHLVIREGVAGLARPLNPKEFRFLRKEIDVSQRQLAAVVGVDEQTISMWERGLSPIQRSAELLLRAWVTECDSDRPAVRQMTERFNALDRELYELEKPLEFAWSGSTWTQKAAA